MKKHMGTRALVYYVKERIAKNQHCVIIVCGMPGSGKSYATLRIGELIAGLEFTEDHITHSVADFFELIQGKHGVTTGSFIALEEAGVLANSRNFYSQINKAIVYLFQTVRHRRYCIVLNLPDISMLDTAVRKLCNVYLYASRINYDHKVSTFIPYEISVDRFKGDLWYKTPSWKVPMGQEQFQRILIKQVKFKLPRAALRHRYEIRKREFTDELYADSLKSMGRLPGEEAKELPLVHRKVLKYLELGHNKSNIAATMGISVYQVGKIVKALTATGKIDTLQKGKKTKK